MENSPYTDVTLEIFETLWQQGYREMASSCSRLVSKRAGSRAHHALGARIRLVKGAYNEPKSVADQKKDEVDARYARMLKTLITDGHYPAIATHDRHDRSRRSWAAQHGVAAHRFEFQMLYGIRRDLQARLIADGFRVRVYVPFGANGFLISCDGWANALPT